MSHDAPLRTFTLAGANCRSGWIADLRQWVAPKLNDRRLWGVWQANVRLPLFSGPKDVAGAKWWRLVQPRRCFDEISEAPV